MTNKEDKDKSKDNIQQNLEYIIKLPQRKLLVCSTDFNLQKNNDNYVYILMIQESKGSAGGRGGGSGHRKIEKIYGYRILDGKEEKILEIENEEMIEAYEIPYSAVAMDVILKTGEQVVVQGIVDKELINSYQKLLDN